MVDSETYDGIYEDRRIIECSFMFDPEYILNLRLEVNVFLYRKRGQNAFIKA